MTQKVRSLITGWLYIKPKCFVPHATKKYNMHFDTLIDLEIYYTTPVFCQMFNLIFLLHISMYGIKKGCNFIETWNFR